MTSERSARIVEIGLSVIASVLTSAVVVSWTISATLAELRVKVDNNMINAAAMESEMASLRAQDSKQSTELAKADAHYEDIVRRLEEMTRKLDKIR